MPITMYQLRMYGTPPYELVTRIDINENFENKFNSHLLYNLKVLKRLLILMYMIYLCPHLYHLVSFNPYPLFLALI